MSQNSVNDRGHSVCGAATIYQIAVPRLTKDVRDNYLGARPQRYRARTAGAAALVHRAHRQVRNTAIAYGGDLGSIVGPPSQAIAPNCHLAVLNVDQRPVAHRCAVVGDRHDSYRVNSPSNCQRGAAAWRRTAANNGSNQTEQQDQENEAHRCGFFNGIHLETIAEKLRGKIGAVPGFTPGAQPNPCPYSPRLRLCWQSPFI